jgi:hypothetical protein
MLFFSGISSYPHHSPTLFSPTHSSIHWTLNIKINNNLMENVWKLQKKEKRRKSFEFSSCIFFFRWIGNIFMAQWSFSYMQRQVNHKFIWNIKRERERERESEKVERLCCHVIDSIHKTHTRQDKNILYKIHENLIQNLCHVWRMENWKLML